MQHTHASLVKIIAFLLLLMSFGMLPKAADSSVRPPDSAVEQVTPWANAQTTPTSQPLALPYLEAPGSELWRAVRQRDGEHDGEAVATRSQMGGEANVLIHASGENWRLFRTEKLIPYSSMLLGIVVVAILIFRLIRGKMAIEAGRSGVKIPRFSPFQRAVHWSVAIMFLILALTGLVLTFGREGLIPLLGKDVFGNLAFVARKIHDYIGPVFAIALVVMLFTFIKGNFASKSDFKWLARGGGMFGGGHVSAGRYNAGEKMWFWAAMLIGAVVVVSGLILDFPIFGLGRGDMETAHMVHAIAAVAILAASFGHIYMGTIGVEGAFESMETGYCDANWAKEHHDEWYNDMAQQGLVGKSFEDLEQEKSVNQASGVLSGSSS